MSLISTSLTKNREISPFIQYTTPIITLLLSVLVLITPACRNNKTKTGTGTLDSIVLNIPAPTPISETEKQRISNATELWYDSMLKNTNFTGGILVAKQGNIVYERYKGIANAALKDSVNMHTPFHIASVSKTITAMCVLKLVQDHKIALDSAYNTYFPEFNYPGVTVRTLLDHRSGLPNYLYFMEDIGWDKNQYIKNQDILDWLINRKLEIKNIGRPDSRFTYCNTNYALLALLIEKASGMSYPAYVKQQVFAPLHMDDSYVYQPADSARSTPSYDWRGGLIPMNFLDNVYGDKNIYSTPRDLLKWDRALTSKLFLGDSLLIQAYTPYSNERPGIKNYGLGWRMNIYPSGKKMVFHNGWWHGNNAVFIRLFDEDATIILVNNRFSHNVYKAKNLVNIFGNYFSDDNEEENESPVNGVPFAPPMKIKPESALQKKLKDRNSH